MNGMCRWLGLHALTVLLLCLLMCLPVGARQGEPEASLAHALEEMAAREYAITWQEETALHDLRACP